jgi:hypothetical protein
MFGYQRRLIMKYISSRVSEEKVMIGVTKNSLAKRPSPETLAKVCPGCGQAMSEVDRVNNDGFTFVWYECNEPGCIRQRMRQYSFSVRQKPEP